MLSDYPVTSCSRQCAVTGRQLQPGESYYSKLALSQGTAERLDYCVEAWEAPSDDATDHVAWWSSRVPASSDSQPQLAPQDVLLNLFIELADQPEEREFRYLLGLILVRKRILRLGESTRDVDGREILSLQCPRRNQTFDLLVAEPAADRADQLQQRIVSLVYSDAA